MQGYLNLKIYGEFDGVDRPHGWNVADIISVARAAGIDWNASAFPQLAWSPQDGGV